MADEPPGADIETRLAAAAEAFREHEMVRRHLAELDQRMDQMASHLAPLREQLSAEQRDVARLESLSLARVLASLEGSRDDQLARERAEAEAIRYRVNDAETYLDALRHESENMRARLGQLAGAPAAYAAVLDEKEQLLRSSDDPRASRLMQIADESGRFTAELREIGEAFRASQVALDALRHLQTALGDPAQWTKYDKELLALRRMGLFRAAGLQSRLNDLARHATYADRCMAALHFEMADVDGVGLPPPGGPPLLAGLTTGFGEVWFAARATVVDRIRFAHHNVARCLSLATEVSNRLTHRASTVQARVRQLADERGGLLAG